MMFDATLQTMELKAVAAEDHIDILAVVGSLLPLGPQALPLPMGILHLPCNKAGAQAFLAELQKAIDEIPDDKPKSDLLIATEGQVDRIARDIGKFK